jgi:hypothetical protein
MNDNIVIIHYAVYILISAALTVWVGKTLFKNGRVFLSDSFNHNEPVVDSVNHLVIVGFYLINFGIVSLFLRYGTKPRGIVDSIELMSTKIGVVLLLLVIMHFLNVFGIAKLRNKSLKMRGSAAQHADIPANSEESTDSGDLEPEEVLHHLEIDSEFGHDGQDVLQPAMNSVGR